MKLIVMEMVWSHVLAIVVVLRDVTVDAEEEKVRKPKSWEGQSIVVSDTLDES